MNQFIREPLVHFLLAGAALFTLFRWVGDADEVDADQQIVVSEGRIEQFATVFAKTWQRPPTREELQGLVDDFVLEEIFYRQAVAMGIDRDDTVIRRRLRQKLEFLTDDATSLADPTDEELQEYLDENQARFRESPKYTFRQLYFNPEKHGDDPKGFLLTQLSDLRSGETVQGDPSLVPEAYELAAQQEIDRNFGFGFAGQLEPLETGKWEGPLRSGLGTHLVRIDAREEGRNPNLDEIRSAVEREWSNDHRVTSRAAINASLRDKYDVIVNWPASASSAQDASSESPETLERSGAALETEKGSQSLTRADGGDAT
ncbi:MAG: peptidyl-prolyl cis-trans isomerase [Rubripirellula sp.]